MSRLILFIIAISSFLFINYYSNPPDGYTGAPISDELSCTVCHYFDSKHIQGYSEIIGLPTNIIAGETYPIEVSINNTDNKALRTSFQLIATDGEKSIGKFSNGSIPVKFSTYKEKTYAESKPGTKLVDGVASFKFDWKAPNNTTNKIISFYSTELLADGDNTFANDKVLYSQAHGVVGSTIEVNVIEQNNNLCRGDSIGSAKIEVLGGNSPYTYNWGNGSTQSNVSNLKSGKHFVTITDNIGNYGIGVVDILEPDILKFSDISVIDYLVNQKGSIDISISGGSGKYTYKWYLDNVLISNDEDLFDLESGYYKIEVNDSCNTKIDTTIYISDISSQKEVLVKHEFLIYPNPANKFVFFQNNIFDEYKVYDISGKLLLNNKVKLGIIKIDISYLKKGLYIFKLSNKSITSSKRFIKI